LSPDEARQQAEAAWLNLVQNSHTDWVLCAICAAQFRPYLPGGMQTSAPLAGALTSHSGSDRDTTHPASVAAKAVVAAGGGGFAAPGAGPRGDQLVTARATTLPAPTQTYTLSTTATLVAAPAFSGDGRWLAGGI